MSMVQAAGIPVCHTMKYLSSTAERKQRGILFLQCFPGSSVTSSKEPLQVSLPGWDEVHLTRHNLLLVRFKSWKYPQICKPAGSPVLQIDSSSAPTESLCVLLDSEVDGRENCHLHAQG